MKKGFIYLAACLLVGLCFSARVAGAAGPAEVEGVIKKNTTWSGDVLIVGDVLVPEGVTLTVSPGANVMFMASESTKIEPMFLSMQTELLVRGVLTARGDKGRPIRFGPAPEAIGGRKPVRGDWGGVIFDGPSASASVLSDADIVMADSAVAAYGSSPTVSGCRIEDSRCGIACMGGSTPRITGCSVTGCEYGVVAGRGGRPVMDKCSVSGNEHDFILKD